MPLTDEEKRQAALERCGATPRPLSQPRLEQLEALEAKVAAATPQKFTAKHQQLIEAANDNIRKIAARHTQLTTGQQARLIAVYMKGQRAFLEALTEEEATFLLGVDQWASGDDESNE